MTVTNLLNITSQEVRKEKGTSCCCNFKIGSFFFFSPKAYPNSMDMIFQEEYDNSSFGALFLTLLYGRSL